MTKCLAQDHQASAPWPSSRWCLKSASSFLLCLGLLQDGHCLGWNVRFLPSSSGKRWCMCACSVGSDSVTLWAVAHQAPLSLGFPREEHWSGCHFLLQGIFPTQGWNRMSCTGRWTHWATWEGLGKDAVLCLVTQSCLTLCDPMGCSLPGFSVPGDSPWKDSGVGCHTLLQGIFPT